MWLFSSSSCSKALLPKLTPLPFYNSFKDSTALFFFLKELLSLRWLPWSISALYWLLPSQHRYDWVCVAWGPRKAWQLECISLWFHKYSLFPRYSHSLEGLLQSPDLNAICVLMTPKFLPPALTIFMYPAVYLIFLCLGLTRMSLILHFVWYMLILYSPCWEADWHAVSSVNLLMSNKYLNFNISRPAHPSFSPLE